MAKVKKVKKAKTLTSLNNWQSLKKGQTFTHVKTFSYNGESWERLIDANGKACEYPAIFFKVAL